jgi:hypothetical protein
MEGKHGQDEAEQCKHCVLTLGDSFSRSNADEVFGTDSGGAASTARDREFTDWNALAGFVDGFVETAV